MPLTATPPTPAAPPEPSAISAEQLQAIADARQAARRIMRAAGVATFSGWTMVLFASITLLGGLFSLQAFLLGIGLVVVAYVELRGAKAVRAFDCAAPRRLALNQIALLVMVTIYAVWGLVHTLGAPGPYDEYIATGGQVGEMLEPIDRLSRFVMLAVYVTVIFGTIAAQGCAAVYYVTRRRHIVAYLQRTPDWIVDALRVSS